MTSPSSNQEKAHKLTPPCSWTRPGSSLPPPGGLLSPLCRAIKATFSVWPISVSVFLFGLGAQRQLMFQQQVHTLVFRGSPVRVEASGGGRWTGAQGSAHEALVVVQLTRPLSDSSAPWRQPGHLVPVGRLRAPWGVGTEGSAPHAGSVVGQDGHRPSSASTGPPEAIGACMWPQDRGGDLEGPKEGR